MKLEKRQESLENLEANIAAEQELMAKNRELEKSLETQYNAGTLIRSLFKHMSSDWPLHERWIPMAGRKFLES